MFEKLKLLFAAFVTFLFRSVEKPVRSFAIKVRFAALQALHTQIAKFILNSRAAISMNAIVGLAIGLIVAAAVLPSAIVDITNATNWTGAPTAVLTLVPVIGIVAVVALLLMVARTRR